jgi:serine/threonine protein kinase
MDDDGPRTPHFGRVRDVFLAVEALDGDARVAELARLCGDDVRLRKKVLRMLDSSAGDSAFLDEPATVDGVTFLGDPLAMPSEIGPYEIVETIGEGGFGVVYRARQTVPIRRDVAIKVIKPGMDTKRVVARFEAERQTLALLHHPNIAQVLDAGATSEGRPYFVMELIEGVPITTYCDRHGLAVEARLELFLELCRAIEHAHQKGVIHRDLKPSNVLIQENEGRPSVKVIDFGIARAIDPSALDATRLTVEAQFLGTPDYMSPEQADPSLGDADTRVDIYALGVILYELLTSTTPLGLAARERTTPLAMRSVICNEEPKRPSTRLATVDLSAVAARRGIDARRLRARLEGDLDWIALRAIEKDRDRRYDSVGSFAADIRRHLAHEPVSAAKPSTWYVTGKFVRRHRFSVAAVGAVVAALAIGLTATAVALARAVVAERDSKLARDESDAVNRFLIDDLLGAASTNREGYTVTVVDAMKHALPVVDERFASQPAVAARVKFAIGSVFRGIGMLEESVGALEAALHVLEREFGPSHPYTIDARVALSDALGDRGKDDEALAVLEPAAKESERSRGPDDPETLRLKARVGEMLQKRGRYAEADALLIDTIERMRRVLPPDNEPFIGARVSLIASLGAQLRTAEALTHSADLLEQVRAAFPPTHPAVLATMNHHAALLLDLKRYHEAELLSRDLLAAVESVMPPGHWQCALTRYNLAVSISKQNRDAEALPMVEQALAEVTAALGADHFLAGSMTVERDAMRARLAAPSK